MQKKIIRNALQKVLAKFRRGEYMPTMNSSNMSAAGLTTVTIPPITSAAAVSTITSINSANISNWNISGVANTGYLFSNGSTPTWTSVLSANGTNGKEIVRLNRDGSVTWSDEINVDEAAEAFGKALQVGAEISAGLTYSVKQRMRDTVFEEMISLAKEKGSLTAEDLTYLHTAAKIMDKLKGKE